MTESVITGFQIFAVGVMLGLSGPCLFVCTPPLVVFFAGQQQESRRNLVHLVVFLLGRVVSYSILGLAAGVSATFLSSFTNPGIAVFLQPIGGLLMAALGLLVWFRRGTHGCSPPRTQVTMGGATLFLLGLALGFSPCPPLVVLLGEVLLISKSWLHGLALGFAFGMGTFVSGFMVLGASGSLVSWLPTKLFAHGGAGRVVYSAVAAALLVGFGLWVVLGSVR